MIQKWVMAFLFSAVSFFMEWMSFFIGSNWFNSTERFWKVDIHAFDTNRNSTKLGPSLITLQILKCLFRFTLRTTWWKALSYILYCCHLHLLPWRHVEIVTLRCNVRGNHVTDSYSVIHLATLCHVADWLVLKPVTSMLMEK